VSTAPDLEPPHHTPPTRSRGIEASYDRFALAAVPRSAYVEKFRTNLAEEVAALKSRPGGGDLLLTGGAALAAALTGLRAFALAEAEDRTVPRWATARRALRSPARAW
jgi:hypothetical protein